MGKCKTKSIQIGFGTFRHIKHIQELFSYIHVYSEPCVTLAYLEPWYNQNPYIFRTLAYSEPRYIQNAGIFKIRGIFRTLSNICENS